MGEPTLRWIETAGFDWTPEQPFRDQPAFVETPFFFSRSGRPEPANRNSTGLMMRLLVGALQAAGLLLLTHNPSVSLLAPALAMVLLFAPIVMLTGFGRLPGVFLLSWTTFVGLAVAALGVYQYWRSGGLIGSSSITLMAIILFIGQVLVTAWARSGQPMAAYPSYHEAAWSLATQLVFLALAATIATVVGGAIVNMLHYPSGGADLIVLPLVTLSVALASWLLSAELLRGLSEAVVKVLTLLLPLFVVLAAAVPLALLVYHWQPPLFLNIMLGSTLLLAINASYRGGEERAAWRRISEAAGSAVLLPLVLIGAELLYTRVTQFGWTSSRIFAAATLGALGLYALAYIASALISLGGGVWMQRIERANLGMALIGLALLAALTSPLADPARLSVQSQVQRAESGKVAPDRFDFSYLKKNGGRFGNDALAQLSEMKSAPSLAHGALLAQITNSDISGKPSSTEIGANISVRTPQGQLPASLISADWSDVPNAPPCLTSTAIACDAYFVDLDGDGKDEIVLTYGSDTAWWGAVMKQGNVGWFPVGTLTSSCAGGFAAMRAGNFQAVEPVATGWRDLMVDGIRLKIQPAAQDTQPSCTR